MKKVSELPQEAAATARLLGENAEQTLLFCINTGTEKYLGNAVKRQEFQVSCPNQARRTAAVQHKPTKKLNDLNKEISAYEISFL